MICTKTPESLLCCNGKHLCKFLWKPMEKINIIKQRYCTFRFMWAQSNKAMAWQCWDSISEGTQENKLPLAKSSLSSTIPKLIKAIQRFWMYHLTFPYSITAVSSHVTKGPFTGIMNGIWCWSALTLWPFLVHDKRKARCYLVLLQYNMSPKKNII